MDLKSHSLQRFHTDQMIFSVFFALCFGFSAFYGTRLTRSLISRILTSFTPKSEATVDEFERLSAD